MLPLHVLFFFHLMPKNADAEEPDALTMAPDLHSSPDAHNFPNLWFYHHLMLLAVVI